MSPASFFKRVCMAGAYAKKIAREKHSSLIVPSASDEENKRMITLQSGVNVTKLFSFIADDEAK